jgi:hypothetical protein
MRRKMTRGLLTVALILGIPVAFVWADPNPCSPCSCSGNGGCSGCQQASSGGMVPLVGNVIVPGGTFYNFCEPQSYGTDSCTTLSIVCWSSPPGTQTPVYALNDTTCSGQAGNTNKIMNVSKSGCIPEQH